MFAHKSLALVTYQMNLMKCNEYKFGFRIEACLTPITRDLLMSLVG